MQSKPSALAITASVLLVVFGTSPAFGHGVIPEATPVDRIIQNLEARLKDKPDDAEMHYRLGRTHGLAFELKTDTVSVWNRQDPTEIAERCWQWKSDPKNEPKDAQLRTHLAEAIKHLSLAIQLDPSPARYHMALGSVLESGLPLAGKIDQWPRPPAEGAAAHINDYLTREINAAEADPEKAKTVISSLRSSFKTDGGFTVRDVVAATLLKRLSDPNAHRAKVARDLLTEDWRVQMGDEYFTAMAFALPADSELRDKPIWGSMDCWIAYDASKCYLRLVKGGMIKNVPPIRKAAAKAVNSSFEDLPTPNAITPIVFPVSTDQSLGSLIDSTTAVPFDLDGSGRPQSWPWPLSSAGILVWDPTNSGKITSGRQLFGSVSWWIFFDNGYQALDALDDNRDGELTGPELKGIAVWIDRNGNGVSDPGEVVPVESFGIRSIRVRATSTEDGCPANRDGLVMADGRVLPTYDWIAQPATSAPATSTPSQPIASRLRAAP
ncbi:MAG TPA: hypothetical protein PKE29_12200 [Phycisphaerales bacterium]|nr:hypothetical protein [Phycisphaerales bacterium]